MPARDLAGDLADEILKQIPRRLANSKDAESSVEEYFSKELSPDLDPEVTREKRLEKIFDRYIENLQHYLPKYLDELLNEEIQNIYVVSPPKQEEENENDFNNESSETTFQSILENQNDPEDLRNPGTSFGDSSGAEPVITTPISPVPAPGKSVTPTDIHNGGNPLEPSSKPESQDNIVAPGLGTTPATPDFTEETSEETSIRGGSETNSKSSDSEHKDYSENVPSLSSDSEQIPTAIPPKSLDPSTSALPKAAEGPSNPSIDPGSQDQPPQTQGSSLTGNPHGDTSSLKPSPEPQSPNKSTEPISNIASALPVPSSPNTEDYSKDIKPASDGENPPLDSSQETPTSRSENNTVTPSNSLRSDDASAPQSISGNDGPRVQSNVAKPSTTSAEGVPAQTGLAAKPSGPADTSKSTPSGGDYEKESTSPGPNGDPSGKNTNGNSSNTNREASTPTSPFEEVTHLSQGRTENPETSNEEAPVSSEVKENPAAVVQNEPSPTRKNPTKASAPSLGYVAPNTYSPLDDPAVQNGSTVPSTSDPEAGEDNEVQDSDDITPSFHTELQQVQSTQEPINQTEGQPQSVPNNKEPPKTTSPPLIPARTEGGLPADSPVESLLEAENDESTSTGPAAEDLKDGSPIENSTTPHAQTPKPETVPQQPYSQGSGGLEDTSNTKDSEVTSTDKEPHYGDSDSAYGDTPLVEESKSDIVADESPGSKGSPRTHAKSPVLENSESSIKSENTDQLFQEDQIEAIPSPPLLTPEMEFDKGPGSPLSESSTDPEDDDGPNFGPVPKTQFSRTHTPIPSAPPGKTANALGLFDQDNTAYQTQQIPSPPVFIVESDQDQSIGFPESIALLGPPYDGNDQPILSQLQNNLPVTVPVDEPSMVQIPKGSNTGRDKQAGNVESEESKDDSIKPSSKPETTLTHDLIARDPIQQERDEQPSETLIYEGPTPEEQENLNDQAQADILGNPGNSVPQSKRSVPETNNRSTTSELGEDQKTSLPSTKSQMVAPTVDSLDAQSSHSEKSNPEQTKGSVLGSPNRTSLGNILPEWCLKTPLLPNILPQALSVSLSWMVPASLNPTFDLNVKATPGTKKSTTPFGSSVENGDSLDSREKGLSNSEDPAVEFGDDTPFLPPPVPGSFPSSEEPLTESGSPFYEGVSTESNTPLDEPSIENTPSDVHRWEKIILLIVTALLEAWKPCFELVGFLTFSSKAFKDGHTEFPFLNTFILDSWTPGLELLHLITSLPHLLPEHIIPESTHVIQPSIELWVPFLEVIGHPLAELSQICYHLYKSLASSFLKLPSAIINLPSSFRLPKLASQSKEASSPSPIASRYESYDDASLSSPEGKATEVDPKRETNSPVPSPEFRSSTQWLQSAGCYNVSCFYSHLYLYLILLTWITGEPASYAGSTRNFGFILSSSLSIILPLLLHFNFYLGFPLSVLHLSYSSLRLLQNVL
ncbi:hypothetical protein TWF718_011127 [Orbilia javanica]|uniref:Uncharacterized protein n=1 Tax=Orbilia javanica TaxID=47235 RepID=A0AAN8MLR1_9PEZI